MKDTTLVIVVVIQLLICQWYVVIIRIEHFLNLCNFLFYILYDRCNNVVDKCIACRSVVRAAGPAGVVVGVVGAAGVVGSVGVGVGAGVIFALFV